jgi:hypothetical protein
MRRSTMNASLNILTVFAITALAELCVLRVWSRRRSFVFCVSLVAAASGIFWGGILFYLPRSGSWAITSQTSQHTTASRFWL